MMLRATPFHMRAADLNRRNAWTVRNGFTLASCYGESHGEALAARFGAVLADISSRTRLKIEGARAAEFLSRLLTRDAGLLAPGEIMDALWLGDGGAVRGIGHLARHGGRSFVLACAISDTAWIKAAAAPFEVELRDLSGEEGGLAIIGPSADALLCVAGLDAGLKPDKFRKFFWGDLDVALLRAGHGYELWCAGDDAPLVWDRLMRAGKSFAVRPIGLEAMDILDMETGTLQAGRDFVPAMVPFVADPAPDALGLGKFIDADHAGFNGRIAWMQGHESRTLAGLEFDGVEPAARGTLLQGARPVGQVLTSLYSPALRRAIALGCIDRGAAAPDTMLRLGEGRQARIVPLPFLPLAGPILPTE